MSYRRVGLALLTAAALLAGVLPPKALADSNARIVRLSYVDGEAQIDRRDGRGFEHAFLNMPLGPGTQVSTRQEGRAEIEFEDMSTVRLAPDTLVETQSLELRSSGAKYTLVDLQQGTAYFNIRKLDDDNDFRVSTGQREFSLTRASRFRLRVDHKQVVLAVFSGEVEVIGESGRLTVRKNETLTLDLDDPARYFLAKGVPEDRYDDWDQERDEYRDRYAKAGNYRGYSSAYSYGVSDLNYWGSYTYISGYGYMWRPNYYGVNWNPYGNGAWYWYPGYGWIWVSAYPWGWMPFRYGNWYYISGHGWCWRPGSQWHHWRPVVAVHNPPPGQYVPTPPPPTGRRDPVIVGHGPSTILPPEDPGPGRRRDPDALGRRGGNPAGGSGSGAVGTPGAGSTGTPTGGSGVNAGSGAGGSVGSGGSGQPAADTGERPAGVRREVDLEDAIRDARERRLGGAQSGGVITNSGPAHPAPSGPSPGSGGTGAPSQDVSPASGRERIPEPRRQLPPSITNDRPTPTSGSSGSTGSVGSGGSSSDSGATAPVAAPAPSMGGGRSPEPRREIPRENFAPSSGSSGPGSSGSGSPNSGSRSSSGWSGGSSAGSGSSSGGNSVHSSPASSPSSSGGRSYSGSSGSSSSGSHASSSSAGSRSSSSGGSSARSSGSAGTSSSSPRSSTTSTPK